MPAAATMRKLPQAGKKNMNDKRKENEIMISRTKSKTGGKRRRLNFAFSAPEASRVQLVGDFTGWADYPINLDRGKNGVWQTTVDLEKGIYHYRFLVDGQWRDDPESVLRIANPFGGQDSVTQVD